MLGPSCARQRRHRSSAVMSSTGPATVICCPAQPRQSAGLLLHWNSANNPPDTFSPGRSFVPQEMLASGSRAEPQQSGSSHSRAVFLHCPDTTTGSGQQAAAKNWLELFDILHGAATAAVNPLLLLSSLASFAFYTGRSFAQFFLVSGLPLCPLSGGINELSGKFSQ